MQSSPSVRPSARQGANTATTRRLFSNQQQARDAIQGGMQPTTSAQLLPALPGVNYPFD